jgi:hypothetical protein
MGLDLRQIIYNIQCELGELRTLIINGFRTLVIREESVVIDEDAIEINFTGDYVSVTQTEQGKVNIDVSIPSQMQPDWAESDIDSPSFIKNKPDTTLLAVQDEGVEVTNPVYTLNFTGPDVEAIETSANTVEVNVEVTLSSETDNGITREVDGLYFRKNYSDGGLPDHVDDAAAATGGVPINGWYRTGSIVKIRVS